MAAIAEFRGSRTQSPRSSSAQGGRRRETSITITIVSDDACSKLANLPSFNPGSATGIGSAPSDCVDRKQIVSGESAFSQTVKPL